jgi:hypothetical protein
MAFIAENREQALNSFNVRVLRAVNVLTYLAAAITHPLSSNS